MSDVMRILSDITVNEAVARDISAGLNEEQLNWQQVSGRSWSILQCLDHMALTNLKYTAAMQRAVDVAPRPQRPWTGSIASSLIGRRFIKGIEPPVRVVKLKAPPTIEPPVRRTAGEVFSLLIESHEAIREVIKSSAGLNLNAVEFRNPFVPLLRPSLGTGLLLLTAHERRHLWQAENVRRAVLAA